MAKIIRFPSQTETVPSRPEEERLQSYEFAEILSELALTGVKPTTLTDSANSLLQEINQKLVDPQNSPKIL